MRIGTKTDLKTERCGVCTKLPFCEHETIRRCNTVFALPICGSNSLFCLPLLVNLKILEILHLLQVIAALLQDTLTWVSEKNSRPSVFFEEIFIPA